MREILFRGRPVSVGEYFFFSQVWKDNCKDGFVYGSLVVDNDRYYISVSAMRSINVCVNNGTTSMIEIIPETVSQFTGLTNISKQRIFENDIVRTTIVHGNRIGKVVFSDGSFHIFVRDYGVLPITTCITVIGDIHNNPELLV